MFKQSCFGELVLNYPENKDTTQSVEHTIYFDSLEDMLKKFGEFYTEVKPIIYTVRRFCSQKNFWYCDTKDPQSVVTDVTDNKRKNQN